MNNRALLDNLLFSTILGVGLGLSGAAAAGSTAGYGAGYGSSGYATPSATGYASPSYPSAAPYSGSSSGVSSSTISSSPVLERQPVGGLLPGETAPPDEIRDPALWAKWQKHGQYEYDRGYEAGRRDAMQYMQSNAMPAEPARAMAAPGAGDPATGYTRMSDRYDGPRVDATAGASPSQAPIGYPHTAYPPTAAEPWWASSWDRMVSSDWPRMQEQLRKRWPQLTGYDMERIRGDRSMLLTVLQDRYNLSNERAHEQVVAWQQQMGG